MLSIYEEVETLKKNIQYIFDQLERLRSRPSQPGEGISKVPITCDTEKSAAPEPVPKFGQNIDSVLKIVHNVDEVIIGSIRRNHDSSYWYPYQGTSRKIDLQTESVVFTIHINAPSVDLKSTKEWSTDVSYSFKDILLNVFKVREEVSKIVQDKLDEVDKIFKEQQAARTPKPGTIVINTANKKRVWLVGYDRTGTAYITDLDGKEPPLPVAAYTIEIEKIKDKS